MSSQSDTKTVLKEYLKSNEYFTFRNNWEAATERKMDERKNQVVDDKEDDNESSQLQETQNRLYPLGTESENTCDSRHQFSHKLAEQVSGKKEVLAKQKETDRHDEEDRQYFRDKQDQLDQAVTDKKESENAKYYRELRQQIQENRERKEQLKLQESELDLQYMNKIVLKQENDDKFEKEESQRRKSALNAERVEEMELREEQRLAQVETQHQEQAQRNLELVHVGERKQRKQWMNNNIYDQQEEESYNKALLQEEQVADLFEKNGFTEQQRFEEEQGSQQAEFELAADDRAHVQGEESQYRGDSENTSTNLDSEEKEKESMRRQKTGEPLDQNFDHCSPPE